MKNQSTKLPGTAVGVSLASAAGESIEIAGQVFTPDHGTAYAEFFLSHAFPVYLDVPEAGEEPDRLAVHPQTVANSYQSLRGKVVNLCHLMVANDPAAIVADKMLGTVMAVELACPAGVMPAAGECWQVQGDPDLAPGIRVVAALHKNAVGVQGILDTWANGKTVFGHTKWTVSIESLGYVETGGFLIQVPARGVTPAGIVAFRETTPADFAALGWIYIPYLEAPKELQACLRTQGGFGITQCYGDSLNETLFLNGGLNGEILYFGVALTPKGKESRARVARMNASALTAGEAAAAEGLRALGELLDAFSIQ